MQAYAEEKGFFQEYSEREQEMVKCSTTSTTFQIFLNAIMNILSSSDKSRCFESVLHTGDFISLAVYKISLFIPFIIYSYIYLVSINIFACSYSYIMTVEVDFILELSKL